MKPSHIEHNTLKDKNNIAMLCIPSLIKTYLIMIEISETLTESLTESWIVFLGILQTHFGNLTLILINICNK